MKNLFYNYKIPKRFSPLSIRYIVFESRNKIMDKFGYSQSYAILRRNLLFNPAMNQIESILGDIVYKQYNSQYVSARIYI